MRFGRRSGFHQAGSTLVRARILSMGSIFGVEDPNSTRTPLDAGVCLFLVQPPVNLSRAAITSSTGSAPARTFSGTSDAVFHPVLSSIMAMSICRMPRKRCWDRFLDGEAEPVPVSRLAFCLDVVEFVEA